MSSCTDVASEQVCYIPCNFCNIILAVSVPCSSLFDMVTVRCGHCSNLWSVNMAAVLQSLSWQDPQAPNLTMADYRTDLGSSSKCSKLPMRATTAHNEERIISRPPEKRQRVPSAYNQFIKEEIQRIKANNPDISHREAFSTAAKNWAHFPHIHFGLMLEANNQAKLDEVKQEGQAGGLAWRQCNWELAKMSGKMKSTKIVKASEKHLRTKAGIQNK